MLQRIRIFNTRTILKHPFSSRGYKIAIPLRCHIPLESIPKPLQKKLNKAEKYLNSLGVKIEKIQLPLDPLSSETNSIDDTSSNVDDSQLKENESILTKGGSLIVGSLHQYPQIAHYNQALLLQTFGKNRLNKDQWSFDMKIQENYGIKLKTAIDYYPFNNTFGDEQDDKKNKKKKLAKGKPTISDWKIRKAGYNVDYKDSFNNRLPRLTRDIGSDEQELVIYRDMPYDIGNLIGVIRIIKTFNPDIILFEYGRIPFFDKYISSRFTLSNIKIPLQKMFSVVLPLKALRISIGNTVYNATKRLYKTEISSYAFESALDFCYRKRKETPIVAADLHYKITDTLRAFNDYLDLYNIATLIHYDIIDNKFIKQSTRVKLGENISCIIQQRLYPHMTLMNSYRNDMLSSVINEIDDVNKYKKILLISHSMRLKDLFDKLLKKTPINKWIKKIENNTHIITNNLNLYNYKPYLPNSKNLYLKKGIEGDEEFKEEIIRCCSFVGHKQTALLLLEYPFNESYKNLDILSDNFDENDFVNDLKDKINNKTSELKQKYA